jgi:hypothetical protein
MTAWLHGISLQGCRDNWRWAFCDFLNNYTLTISSCLHSQWASAVEAAEGVPYEPSSGAAAPPLPVAEKADEKETEVKRAPPHT